MVQPTFVPAAELSGAFYREVVRAVLRGEPHAAALLGWGSDVLGYDTERSTDHGWGPRLLLFVGDHCDTARLEQRLSDRLPDRFRGWPVRYGWDRTPVSHHVTVATLAAWVTVHLGVDATAGMSILDWLATPQQRLLGVVSGAVYADDTGALGRLRDDLAWYPDEVWRWLLGCQWHRLAQEEAFVARTAEVADETGSVVTAARLVRDVMRLALLLDRRYAPYQKWLGTAFARGTHADDLPDLLTAAVHAADLSRREKSLGEAYAALARRQNQLAIVPPVDASTRNYFGRPGCLLMADRLTEACLATVTDPRLRALPLVGSVDQVVDSADVLEHPRLYRSFSALYS